MNDFEINDNRILEIIEQELSKENDGSVNRYNPFELLKSTPLLDETIKRNKKSPKNKTGFISDVY